MRWRLIGNVQHAPADELVGQSLFPTHRFIGGAFGKIPVGFFIFLFLFGKFARAHESRPLYVKITEDSIRLTFEINLPNTVNTQNFPIIFLDSFAVNQNLIWSAHPSGFRQKVQIPKPKNSLRGLSASVEYPVFNPVISTILAITFEDGEDQIFIIPPNENAVEIPKEAKASEVRFQYSILGTEHIWAGIDHLLFVVCLLIITGFSRKLFITITGFTIAHSVTLILSALKIIQLPIPPIEATIALSIVFLCYEIIHHHSDKNSLTYRYPILVASSFGLLHGLGFAAVLGEIGLPPKHSFEALLFFNIGVEIGQIIFIGVLFVAAFFISKIGDVVFNENQKTKLLSVGLKTAIYLVGIIAAYWMFDRIL